MKISKVVYSKAAVDDLDEIVAYITNLYRLEAGLRYKEKIQKELEALAYSANAFTLSRYEMVKYLHPEVKTLSIMKHRWTAIFHIDGDLVLVDRIIQSKMIIE